MQAMLRSIQHRRQDEGPRLLSRHRSRKETSGPRLQQSGKGSFRQIRLSQPRSEPCEPRDHSATRRCPFGSMTRTSSTSATWPTTLRRDCRKSNRPPWAPPSTPTPSRCWPMPCSARRSAQFEFAAIFESQVEPQNRDFALTAGKRVFKAYKLCGAYDDLLKQLQQSVEPPRFEFKVDGLILGVPFTGKPDCRFVLDLGQGRIPCIYDWKVRGYCSKYGASPSKGYATCLDGFVGKASRSQGKEHAMYKAMDFRGLTINSGYMEFCNDEYADQLCLYGWLLGREDRRREHGAGNRGIVREVHGRGQPAHAPLRPPSRPGQGRLPAEARRESGRPAGRPSPAGTSSRPSAAKTAMPAAPSWKKCPWVSCQTGPPWTSGSQTQPAPASFTKSCPSHCSCSTGSRVPP